MNVDINDGRPYGLFALCGGSLLLNAVLLARLAFGGAAPPPTTLAVTPSEDAAAVASVASLGEVADAAPAAEAVVAAAVRPPRVDGLKVVVAPVSHSLARTFQGAAPDGHGDVLSAIYARLFVWDVDLRRDLLAGDQVGVAYRWDGDLASIDVARFVSKKHGKTYQAYAWQKPGDAFPSYWDENGREVPGTLIDGPVGGYEQITALLKDRPTHKGMDFKGPEGLAVIAPKAGSVVRTDWNVKYNGNCVEVRYDDGTTAKFLHLSQTAVKGGQRVAKGARLGALGNTGRSTAPHLHYELERGGKVLDPIDYHGVKHRQLAGAELEAFHAVRAGLDALLTGES